MPDHECPVCYELTPDVLPECGHTLCFACAKRCFQYASTPRCPLCRTEVAWARGDDDDDDGAGVLFFRARPVPHTFLPELVRLHSRLTLLGLYTARRRTHEIALVPSREMSGLQVIRLPEDTPASHRFLQVGDIVTHVNGYRVETEVEALRYMRASGFSTVWVSVWRRVAAATT